MAIRSTGVAVTVCALSCQSGEPPRDANRVHAVVDVPVEPPAAVIARESDASPKPEPEAGTATEEPRAAAVGDRPPASDSTARAGTECRSPDEPGCNPCFVPNGNGSCQSRAWEPIPNPTKERIAAYERETGEKLVPAYNSFASVPKCPEHYARCARCSLADEKAARGMRDRAECDCSQEQSIDPCFSEDSCECWCIRARAAKARCPEFFGRGKR